MDISADLEELAQTPVLVVCAGAKSILDIGRTLEYLETKGVPVVGYQTSEMPAFYTRKSGFGVDYRLDTPREIAASFYAKRKMEIPGGMLVANPIPEQYAMDADYINGKIDEAVADAERGGSRARRSPPSCSMQSRRSQAAKAWKRISVLSSTTRSPRRTSRWNWQS